MNVNLLPSVYRGHNNTPYSSDNTSCIISPETLDSVKLESYLDTCHCLGLTNFQFEPQEVVDDTRKLLPLSHLHLYSERLM